MISIKSAKELESMRVACEITRDVLNLIGENIRPGVTTKELDKIGHEYMKKLNVTPAFLNYGGFPAANCISVNEQVIHGIPSDRALKEGDIVSVDTGAIYKGFYGDAARTFAVGRISVDDEKLIEVTKQSFFEAVKTIVPGARLGDIGNAVETYVEANGFGVVRAYVGHGVGHELHEDPQIPNYGTAGRGVRLKAGMTLAIEPMVNAGTFDVKVLSDNWTVVTADGKNSAHYENTVLVTENGAEILTL